MTRLADIVPRPPLLLGRRCIYCLLPWCETVLTNYCPFCGLDWYGELADASGGEAA